MKRMAFHLLAFASFVIFVAMFIVWARGGWVDRRISRHLIGDWYYDSDGGSYDHLVQLMLAHPSAIQIVGPQLGPNGISTPVCDAWQKQFAPRTHLTSGPFTIDYETMISVNSQRRLVACGKQIRLILPFWAAIAMWAILPAIVWIFLPIHHRLRLRESASRSMASVIAKTESVLADQPCIHCGYNLRTLKIAGQCPECGAAVAETISANSDLSQAPPRWLMKLAIANVLLFLSRITLAATYVAGFQRNGGFVAEYTAAIVLAGMTIVLYLSGALLLTAGAHLASSRGSVARRFRGLVMVSMTILAAGALYQLVFTRVAPRPFGLMGSVSVDWYWGSTVLTLIGWILFCLCILQEFFFLAHMLLRTSRHLFASYCKIAGVGLAASSFLLTYMARDIIEQWQIFNALEVAVAAFWFAFLAWAGLLNLRVGLRFMRLAKRSQQQNSSLVSII